MKKLFALFLATGMFVTAIVTAQSDTMSDTSNQQTQAPATTPATQNEESTTVVEEDEDKGLHQVIKEKFIEGDVRYMTPVLICLILGLAVAIERIITLSYSTINKDRFVEQVEDAVKAGGIESAKELCRTTKGPISSIFYQGLDRSHEGIDVVEKTIVSYGSVTMGQLEKGLIWISLFIALAPMLGFLGTVIGMIQAFDKIAEVGEISPAVVAGGIKVALLTTVAGLIVAIILQLFYNYIVSKVDSIVNNMEEASIDLVDILVKNNAISIRKEK